MQQTLTVISFDNYFTNKVLGKSTTFDSCMSLSDHLSQSAPHFLTTLSFATLNALCVCISRLSEMLFHPYATSSNAITHLICVDIAELVRHNLVSSIERREESLQFEPSQLLVQQRPFGSNGIDGYEQREGELKSDRRGCDIFMNVHIEGEKRKEHQSVSCSKSVQSQSVIHCFLVEWICLSQ